MPQQSAIDLAPVIRPEPKRDKFGRYVLPDPVTGKDVSWTRATTWAKTCSDTFGLTKWELRMAVFGLARRPDLLAQAATVTDTDDKDAKRLLDGVANDAKEAAGSSIRRNLGVALHSMTELIDAGADYTVPDAHRADLDAYMDVTGALTIDRDHIERIVVVPELQVAGTFDRLVTLADGRLMVADLKTGRDLAYSWTEIAIQLALYAHAATIWDGVTGTHLPMPPVDQNEALVIHLPVGEAKCTLHTIDIAAGWEMAQVCGTVRDWRKRRNLAKPLNLLTEQLEASVANNAGQAPQAGDAPVATPVDAADQAVVAGGPEPAGSVYLAEGTPGYPTTTADLAKIPDGARPSSGASSGPGNGDGTDPARSDADRTAWIVERIALLRGVTPELMPLLTEQWPADIAKRPPWTDEQIDAISAVLYGVERSFPPTDPATPPPAAVRLEPVAPPLLPSVIENSPPASAEDVAGLRAAIKGLAEDQHRLAMLTWWAKQGRDHDRPWDSTRAMTMRCWSITRGVIRFLTCVGADDKRLRMALAYVLGDDLDETWPTGAVLGSLTTDQAEEVAELSRLYRAKDTTTRAVIDAVS